MNNKSAGVWFGDFSISREPGLCVSNCLKMALAQKAFCPTVRHTAAKGVRVRVAAAGPVKVWARESRIGAKPIKVPKGVTVTVDGLTLKVKVRGGEGGSRLHARPLSSHRCPQAPSHRDSTGLPCRAPRESSPGLSCPRLLSR